MKTIITCLLMVATIYSGFTAKNTFEGTMVLSLDSESGSSLDKINLMIKNNKVAIDVGEAKAPRMVLDLGTGDIYSEIKQGNQYMVIKMNLGALNEIGGLPLLIGPAYSQLLGRDAENEMTVDQTSETKAIGGYKCTKYNIKSESHQGSVWATTELPFDFSALFNMIGESEGSGNFYKSIPLQGSLKDLKNGEVTNFSITALEKAIDDKIFTFPENYPEMDMTSLLKQLVENGDPEQIKQVLSGVLQR